MNLPSILRKCGFFTILSLFTFSQAIAYSPQTMVGGLFIKGESGGALVQKDLLRNDDISGFYMSIPWSQFQTEVDTFETEHIKDALNAAVENDQYVVFGIGAGGRYTPEEVLRDAGVPLYEFEDTWGSNATEGNCGTKMLLGNPTDESYQREYFKAIRALGEIVASNELWMDHVAYIKLSGANLLTQENRLPKSVAPGCINNSRVWAEAGYTPNGIVDFYTKQMEVVQEVFPGKPMIYALIQAGFPKTNNYGDYLLENGQSSGAKLINGITQTEMILESGIENYGKLFVPSHNGIRANALPNFWTRYSSETYGVGVAYQTANERRVSTLAQLQATLENLRENTLAHYLEIYPNLALEAIENDGKLVEESESEAEFNTLEEWDAYLKSRAPELELEGPVQAQ